MNCFGDSLCSFIDGDYKPDIRFFENRIVGLDIEADQAIYEIVWAMHKTKKDSKFY